MTDMDPFPTELEFEQDDQEGFGGPRKVKINGQSVMVHSLEVRWSDQEFVEVTIRMQGVRVRKMENKE